MKVVALVSGGKDSCYAMMRCVDYGHEVVALANLLPLEDSIDELDSYMYQTVGHQVVVSYAECMGLPLFRRRIRGSTRHTNLSYKTTSGDEVEDMYALLKEVKKKFPSITAVSSGAIASDYQRLRVESVCSRLGLISLAYLWKQDQTLLLEEMIERGIIAITVKVAAMGLIPAKHLGKEIAELQGQLLILKELYGINVCGEGGEYETLTLDCPLFKHARIILDDFKILLHSADSIASVGVLHPLAFHLEHKLEIPSLCNSSNEDIIDLERRIHILEVQDDFSNMPRSQIENFALRPCATKDEENLQIPPNKTRAFTLSSWNSSASTLGLKENLTSVLARIESQLDKLGLGWSNVLYIHLYISDMSKFSLANEVYLQFITENKCYYGVPSRSTIELPLLPDLGNAYVEVLVSKDCSKKVLHVQSISCWAPSCIGPYSQATLHREILYMAGQLGLDPPTMNLCSGGPAAELDQALENCEAVARSFNCSLVSSTILLVIYCSSSLTAPDCLGIQQRVQEFFSKKDAMPDSSSLLRTSKPIFLYVLVPALPKNALVEVKPLLYVPENQELLAFCSIQNDAITEIPPELDIREFNVKLSSEKYIIPEKICLAMVSIVYNNPDLLPFVTDKGAADNKCYDTGKHFGIISRVLVFALNKILLQSKLSWNEMTSLRIYFATTFCEAANTLRNTFSEAFAELFKTNDNNPVIFDFALIPVLNAAHSPVISNLLTCELFASKHGIP